MVDHFGNRMRSRGADYPQPLETGGGQIYGKPLTQSKSVCYQQQTYQDLLEENDEYFILRVVPGKENDVPNVGVDPLFATTLVWIVDDDGKLV